MDKEQSLPVFLSPWLVGETEVMKLPVVCCVERVSVGATAVVVPFLPSWSGGVTDVTGALLDTDVFSGAAVVACVLWSVVTLPALAEVKSL